MTKEKVCMKRDCAFVAKCFEIIHKGGKLRKRDYDRLRKLMKKHERCICSEKKEKGKKKKK